MRLAGVGFQGRTCAFEPICGWLQLAGTETVIWSRYRLMRSRLTVNLSRDCPAVRGVLTIFPPDGFPFCPLIPVALNRPLSAGRQRFRSKFQVLHVRAHQNGAPWGWCGGAYVSHESAILRIGFVTYPHLKKKKKTKKKKKPPEWYTPFRIGARATDFLIKRPQGLPVGGTRLRDLQ